MQVVISDLYSSTRHTLEGDENDVRSQILDLYSFLLMKFGPHCSVDILVNALNKNQSTIAKKTDQLSKSTPTDGTGLHQINCDPHLPHGQLNTQDAELDACNRAAAFLSGKEATSQELRQASLQTECPQKAALLAHGLPLTALSDLLAILQTQDLKKSEDDQPVTFKDINATNQSSEEFAKIVKQASDEGEIKKVQLGAGKHAAGMLLARNSESHKSYVLKPGSGKQNSIIGENESGSTQSQREAAFYAVACAFGLGEFLPECHLLLLDGKEYACFAFLPHSYKIMNDLKAKDPNLPKRLFALYNDGVLHKFAAMDYILGNPDRHLGNVMASGDSVKLIDHGSSFAGLDFNPAKDGMSFVPCYLRAGTQNFNGLSVDQKLRVMPRLNAENEKKVRKWLLDLDPGIMGQIIMQYGIDPAPEQKRLESLQQATSYQTVDLAILSSWVLDR